MRKSIPSVVERMEIAERIGETIKKLEVANRSPLDFVWPETPVRDTLQVAVNHFAIPVGTQGRRSVWTFTIQRVLVLASLRSYKRPDLITLTHEEAMAIRAALDELERRIES